MVGSVVASAVDPFWSFLRLDPDDVFAVKLKKKVLENRSSGWDGFCRWITLVQTSRNDKNAPGRLDVRRSLGQFCLGLDGCARPPQHRFRNPKRLTAIEEPSTPVLLAKSLFEYL
jgi:hypothetical protein